MTPAGPAIEPKPYAFRAKTTRQTTALREAMAKYGKPEIFNTGQGSRFTGIDFTDVPDGANVAISMDGRGRRMDKRAMTRQRG